MNKEINNSKSVYPSLESVRISEQVTTLTPYDGLTMRDYFAGQMLVGVMTNAEEYRSKYNYIELAKYCYHCADAMLKAREASNDA